MVGSSYHLKLYVSPGSCARVSTIALEEIGVPFETELVRMKAKQHKSPEYLAINPKGKVPALAIGGKVLTENVAIITWLNKTFPDANLLPQADSDLDQAQQTSDLSFFSSTMHPFVTRYARPEKFVTDANVAHQVQTASLVPASAFWSMIDDRMTDREWWYGDQWSAVDGYLFWVWTRIAASGFDGSVYAGIASHADRMLARPAVARSMAREAASIEQLKSEGLYEPPR